MIRTCTALIYLAIISVSSSCTSTTAPITVPTPHAKAINQIYIQKNGCGPSSLINAYRFGSPKWNAANQKITGDTDKKQFDFLVKYYGRIFSRHIHASQRWNPRTGINNLDLTDLANDFQTKQKLNLPKLKLTTHFIKTKKSHSKLLKSTHKHFTASLKKGFPPIISIKRFAQKGSVWRQVHGHFVVIHQIPKTLPPNATAFEVKYIDPWGGTIKSGTIQIPKKAFFAINAAEHKPKFKKSPTLTIDFPQSTLGRHLLKKHERSATILDASITP